MAKVPAAERELPPQYTEVAHVRFDDVKTGFLYDLRSVLPGIILTVAGWASVKPTMLQILISSGIFALSIYPYFCLHEITHGLVYKAITGQNVTIGFRKGGAYCGLPDLYVYRNVSVICTAAPLAVFSALFVIGTLLLIFAGNWLFLPPGLLFLLHLLGCRSDVNLLRALRKYHDESLLVRDSGTEQWFYQQASD